MGFLGSGVQAAFWEFGFQTALAFACFCCCFLVQGEEEGGAAAVVVAAFVAVCRIDGFVQGAVGLVQAGEGGGSVRSALRNIFR